jgi:WD40 repeat protein/GAF domain-containing protein
MATPGAEFVRFGQNVQATSSGGTEAELQELEKEIARSRDWPIHSLLNHVVAGVSSITHAHGAAIAVCDQWGVICRASAGEAPEVGSRLRPDSALTRECFETGQVVVCEDAENDDRVRRSTANYLRLRSVVIVPLASQGSVLGVIEVLSSRPSAFSPAHIVGLQRIGQLLASILAPAPVDTDIAADVLVGTPAQSEELVEIAVAPPPTVAPPKEPRSTVKVFLVAGAAVLLLLLLVWLAVPRLQQMTRPSARTLPPAPVQNHPAQQQSIRPESTQPQALESDGSSHQDFPAPASKSLPGPPLSQPMEPLSPAREKAPSATGDTVEDAAAPVIRPVVPAIVIQGTLPGTQIFVDDQLVASTNPVGQAGVSTLAAGQHHLRLRVNGYQDYDQDVNVQTGKTSTINAKLDLLELPTLSEPSKSPVLSVTTAIPAPVILTRPNPPDFVLDRTFKAHNGWVTTVAFSPDGRRLASGSWDRTVKIWEVSTGEQLGAVVSDMKEVQSLTFSGDGHWLATENSSDTTSLRDPLTGQEIRSFPSDKPLGALGSNWVYSIAFSPDGKWLASAIDDKTVRLWDVNTGRKVRDLTGLRRAVVYIAFSPDGRLLATGDDQKNIRIWDPASGEEIYKLSGHKKLVYAVAFSPDGRWLASASADKTVKIWDLAIGHERHTLAGHANMVTSLAFSPDGRWLVSASWDKTIKIWDVEAGREVHTLTGHEHPIYSVAFDSRGQWLASGSEDGTIKIWRLRRTADQSGSLR